VEGTIDPFDFQLARDLGMTVEQMRHGIGNPEYLQWRAYHVWRNAQIELETKEAVSNVSRNPNPRRP
jgi:hypothetical protein